jgi:hypothetical protein
MNAHLKRKILFALSMGVVTTGIISFAILGFNRGFSDGFAFAWLRSWGLGLRDRDSRHSPGWPMAAGADRPSGGLTQSQFRPSALEQDSNRENAGKLQVVAVLMAISEHA